MTTSEGLDAVVERLRTGDREAIGEIYRAVAPGLRAWLRTQVRHGEVADDLVEATFVELIGARSATFDSGDAVRAWLFRAARNNLIDWRRKAERRADHALDDHIAVQQADTGVGPEELAVRRDAVAEVLDAMRELSDEQREVLQLRLLGELSGAEVAALTGNTEGGVRALQHRGMRSLSRVLERRRTEASADP